MPPPNNGFDKHGERILSELADLKSGQVTSRENHGQTRIDLAVLVETVSNLAKSVGTEMPKHSKDISDLRANKADRKEVGDLKRQGSIIGVIGGAIGIILLWLRGKI